MMMYIKKCKEEIFLERGRKIVNCELEDGFSAI